MLVVLVVVAVLLSGGSNAENAGEARETMTHHGARNKARATVSFITRRAELESDLPRLMSCATALGCYLPHVLEFFREFKEETHFQNYFSLLISKHHTSDTKFLKISSFLVWRFLSASPVRNRRARKTVSDEQTPTTSPLCCMVFAVRTSLFSQ